MARARAREPDLLEVAFAVVAERGVRGLDRAEVARRAGVSLAAVYEALPTRAALVTELGRRLDRAMLDLDPAELGPLGARERLFELIMRRLDAAAPFRAGLARLIRELRGDPRLALRSLCNLDRTAEWWLELAGWPVAGPRRCLLTVALVRAYARTFETWLGDESEDLARTLATLDRELARVERLARLVGVAAEGTAAPRRPGPAAAEEGAPA